MTALAEFVGGPACGRVVRIDVLVARFEIGVYGGMHHYRLRSDQPKPGGLYMYDYEKPSRGTDET